MIDAVPESMPARSCGDEANRSVLVRTHRTSLEIRDNRGAVRYCRNTPDGGPCSHRAEQDE